MDATELQKENQRLKELLEKERAQCRVERKQHAAEVEQFSQALDEKQQSIARLEHRIKLLLQKVRGSRQERINPDQLTLFSNEELQTLVDELEQHAGDEPLIETKPSRNKKRKGGRQGKLPTNLPRTVIRHELPPEELNCPGCGQKRHEIGVESSEQLEFIPARLKVIQHDRVKEVACWIHARRYWHQAQDNDAVRANKALSFIAQLSQIEKQLRQAYPAKDLQGHRDFESVAAARQEHATPVLKRFKVWLDEENENKRILPKSPIRTALIYTLNQWEALCRYTEAGYLSLDNNLAERAVKIPAIGRKNYLFVGSAQGGHRAALHYSLVSSAKSNGVEPLAWLTDVFTQLPYHRSGEAFEQVFSGQPVSSEELDYLLPDVWLKSNPAHQWTIDHIRRAERRANQK